VALAQVHFAGEDLRRELFGLVSADASRGRLQVALQVNENWQPRWLEPS